MTDHTFGGQLAWEIEAQNFETDTIAEGIERDILATRAEWTDIEKKIISELSIILSCTKSLAIIGTKKPAPAVLRMVEVLTVHPEPAALIEWRLKLPYKLRDAWHSAWAEGQDMFSVDPAQLPTSALTPSQLEELKDKNSPLAAAG